VTLAVTGACGEDTETKTAYINPVSLPEANFTTTNQTPCSGTSVQFTANCTGTVDTYSWNFGDGGSSSDSNPSHTYQTTNSCTVTLVVTGPCGTDTQTKAAYINPVSLPEADFVADNQTPCSGTAVSFTANCTGTVDTYSWTFGNGNNSSDSNPSHTYQTTNSCTVTLVVTSRIEDEKADPGVGIDLGAIYRPKENLQLGLRVQNLLSLKMKFIEEKEALPLSLNLGIAYFIPELFKADRLTLLLDLKIPNDNDIAASLGAEYLFREKFAARLGYRSDIDQGPGISVGLGLGHKNYTFDYAFLPYGDLDDTHRLSFGISF